MADKRDEQVTDILRGVLHGFAKAAYEPLPEVPEPTYEELAKRVDELMYEKVELEVDRDVWRDRAFEFQGERNLRNAKIAKLEGELRGTRAKAFEEAAELCDGEALILHVTDPNNEAGLSAENGAARCADLIRLKAEAAKEAGDAG